MILTKPQNLLPFDGEVYYFGRVLDEKSSLYYFDKLLKNISWKNDEAIIFGKKIITKRKAAWYGSEVYSYTYSKVTKNALPWNQELLELKEIVEILSGSTFNSCLLNLYHSGDEGMAWHSDGEKELLKNGVIASVSLGAERRFCFKHKKTKDKCEIVLENGSLLTMEGCTQENWLHKLPPSRRIKNPRINLTFRTIDIKT